MKQIKAQRAAATAPAALPPTAEALKKAGDKPWLHKRIIVKVRPGHASLLSVSNPNLCLLPLASSKPVRSSDDFDGCTSTWCYAARLPASQCTIQGKAVGQPARFN